MDCEGVGSAQHTDLPKILPDELEVLEVSIPNVDCGAGGGVQYIGKLDCGGGGNAQKIG